MKLETKYDRGQEVRIVPLNFLYGRIAAIWFGDSGLQYNVRYFDGVEPKTVYFYEDELSLTEPQIKPGFQAQ